MLVNSWIRMGSAALAGLMVVALTAAAHAPTTLKDAYKGDFVIGAAMDAGDIIGQNQRDDAIIETHFNSISPEDVLKWEIVHPQPDKLRL